MIKQIKFTNNYRCFNRGDVFNFEIITPLVGDQGCGKSSLLSLLGQSKSECPIDIILDNPQKVSETFYLDFEKNPLRNPKCGLFSRDSDTFKSQVANIFQSHGQVVNNTFASFERFKSGNIIFMDEPDMALSCRSIVTLASKIKDMGEKGIQVIFSCHNPLLIEKMVNVLSLEEKKWVGYKDFFKQQFN